MSGNETEIAMAGRAHPGVADRTPEAVDLPAHASELSSRAIAERRPTTLDAQSVVHLQALAGNASVSRLLEEEQAPDKVRAVLGHGGGERMDPRTAATMGARLGEDFSDVRIHHGGRAAESARAVSAHAYTVGSDVVFDSGKYDPASPAGQRTLAHELTHVIQQRQGAVSGVDIGGGMAVSDPSDRYEQAAAANADRVMSSATPGSGAAMSAQCHADDDRSADVAQRGIAIENLSGDEEQEDEGSGAGLMSAQRVGDDELQEDEAPA